MADLKISQLTATTAIADADLLTTVEGGVNKRITGTTLKTVIGWERSGTDVTPKIAGDNINIGTGGLKDNDVVTAIELGDASNISFDTTNKTIIGALNQVLASIPNANKDTLTVSGDGQTAFTLAATPDDDASFKLFLNGTNYPLSGTHYNRAGTALTWLDPGGLTLKTTDEFVAIYNDVGNSALSNWSDDMTDLTPTNAGRNVDIGTGLLKDNDVTAGIALGDGSNTALDAAFTATSILGALNENKTRETFITKTFGDSPYSAVAGDNAIAGDTSGGAVTITLPSAASNPGVRIRVSKVTSDSNAVTLATTGGDTVGFQSQWILSDQGDSTTAISDGVSEWILFTERHSHTTKLYQLEYDANLGDHRVQQVGSNSAQNFEFAIPPDFLSLISLKLSGYPTAGAAGAAKDIDLFSDYNGVGELFNTHSESDTTTTYDFTGQTDRLVQIDLSGVFTSLSAQDRCGIQVDHNVIGGSINYVDIELEYRRAG